MSNEDNQGPTQGTENNGTVPDGSTSDASAQEAKASLSELNEGEANGETLGDVNDFSAVYNVPVQISAVLGRAVMPVSQLLKLGRGAVVELDRRVGESVDIYVNNRLVARGEVVIVDERLGITMTEIIKSER